MWIEEFSAFWWNSNWGHPPERVWKFDHHRMESLQAGEVLARVFWMTAEQPSSAKHRVYRFTSALKASLPTNPCACPNPATCLCLQLRIGTKQYFCCGGPRKNPKLSSTYNRSFLCASAESGVPGLSLHQASRDAFRLWESAKSHTVQPVELCRWRLSWINYIPLQIHNFARCREETVTSKALSP